MPYEQMSDVLDTSVGALKASYHHAVAKVEQWLRREVAGVGISLGEPEEAE